jgi:AraC family transcriptional regulator
MSESVTGGRRPAAEADWRPAVRQGVDVYGSALGAAGGTEIEALMRSRDRTAICAAIYMAPPYDVCVPSLPVSRLSVNLTRAQVSGGVDGERQRRFEAGRYSLFLTPSGAPVKWRKDSPSRHLNIYFHPDVFDGDDEDTVLPFAEAQPVFNASVPGIRHLADQLVEELGTPSVLNADAADSLARLMLVRLARNLQQVQTTSRPLTPKLLASLRAYVLEHLAEPILVADLARHAGLSLNRFAHSYSEQTGQSPHRFILALRLKHAAEMLRQSTCSVAEVAHTSGFANQQHLTNAMRRHLGVTPSRYRALALSNPGPEIVEPEAEPGG